MVLERGAKGRSQRGKLTFQFTMAAASSVVLVEMIVVNQQERQRTQRREKCPNIGVDACKMREVRRRRQVLTDWGCLAVSQSYVDDSPATGGDEETWSSASQANRPVCMS